MNGYDLPGIAAIITSVALLLGALGWGKFKGGRLTTPATDPNATVPEKMDALVDKADAALVTLDRIEQAQKNCASDVGQMHEWAKEAQMMQKAIDVVERRRSRKD